MQTKTVNLYLKNLGKNGNVLTVAQESNSYSRDFCIVLFDDQIDVIESLLARRDSVSRIYFKDEQNNSEVISLERPDYNSPEFDRILFHGDHNIRVSREKFEAILERRKGLKKCSDHLADFRRKFYETIEKRKDDARRIHEAYTAEIKAKELREYIENFEANFKVEDFAPPFEIAEKVKALIGLFEVEEKVLGKFTGDFEFSLVDIAKCEYYSLFTTKSGDFELYKEDGTCVGDNFSR